MTSTEITQHQYELVMGENPSVFTGCPNCPLEGMDWEEAKTFCESVGGSLPSGAQWEYAARAGTTDAYTCGAEAGCLDDIAWYDGNAEGSTHPVGGKDPNAFGLYDMLGNVFEWVEDCYHADYNGAPANGEAWVYDDCWLRMLRGGGWDSSPFYLRASCRHGGIAGFRSRSVGFRCSR